LYLPLNRTCFTFLSFIFLVYIHCSRGFCHGISSMNILYFYYINPSFALPYSFFPACYSTVFSASSTHMNCILILFTQVIYIYIYVHIHSYLYTYMFICICLSSIYLSVYIWLHLEDPLLSSPMAMERRLFYLPLRTALCSCS
jgi:hypothetical protein